MKLDTLQARLTPLIEKSRLHLQNPKFYWTTVITLGFLAFLLLYWGYRVFFPSTDDAYVQAHVIDIAAQVSGPVLTLQTENYQMVKKDQELFQIDPKPFQFALDKAAAAYQLALQSTHSQSDQVKAAQAQVKEALAKLDYAKKQASRFNALAAHGEIAKDLRDKAESDLHVAESGVQQAQNNLLSAEETLGAEGENNATIQQAKAALQEAQLNLAYTQIRAPAEGYVVNFALRPGSMVTAQQPLFSLVEAKEWWVIANYKETELSRIKKGQTASIQLDMYPHHTFKGEVVELARGSGASFSLLPPEDATGNWVKVTQRFPVKIKIFPEENYPLRIGASAVVVVNTL